MTDSFAWGSTWDNFKDNEVWRGNFHIADWPEEPYLAAEYGLFLHDYVEEMLDGNDPPS